MYRAVYAAGLQLVELVRRLVSDVQFILKNFLSMPPKQINMDAAAELNQLAMTLLTLARDNKFVELDKLAQMGMPLTLGNQVRDQPYLGAPYVLLCTGTLSARVGTVPLA